MKKINTLFLALFLAFNLFGQKYNYKTFENDPVGVKIYTLENGLKVYLSVNKDQPRVQTFITVRTGSKNDPADVTGLAHYLEHMVFKGTSKMGTSNWEAEKVLLQKISDLYEKHKNEPDPAKKREIYIEIDKVSQEAAKYAIANEYDKMISGLGAKGTNAFTSLEETAYINDIPATELEKWMMVESERFGELVLRLFHTELEAVYEEYNRGLDNDYSKAYHAMNKLLYTEHPYGTQTTIGEGEHLKNPSMVKIHEYFNQYYVPNNMAICLAGDIDPDQTMDLIIKYFGKLKPKEVNPRKMPTEKPITEPRIAEVFGPMNEWVSISFRIGGYHTEDAILADLASTILYNGQAGLIDLNLMQKQKVLRAAAYSSVNNDYGSFGMQGNPKSGQTLEEVKDMLLAELEKFKKGEFSEDLMAASIKNMKAEQLNQLEANWLRAYKMSKSFIFNGNWNDEVTYYDRMSKITKQQLIDWANRTFSNNYCIVYKRTGEDNSIQKVEKPQITPVELNRDDKSEFYQAFEQKESLRLQPLFIDYKKAIQQKPLKEGVNFYYIPNQTNELFTLFIEVDEDLKNDKKMALALKYLPYLGTDKYTAEDIKKKFYGLAVDYDTRASSDEVYIYMSGLNESFKEAFELLQHILSNAVADENALTNLIEDELKRREDAKKNKGSILYGGLRNYAIYGKKNRFNDVLSETELKNIKSDELIKNIKSLTQYKHDVFYYGQTPFNDMHAYLIKTHKLPTKFLTVSNPINYQELEKTEPVVYFVDYDMVQSELMMISRGEQFNVAKLPYINMFNNYFGSGLSSIVFQEIREAKALAYSANARVSTPNKKDEAHYVTAYVGTQVDKLPAAVDAMLELMNKMPKAEIQFNESKISALKTIESDRIIKSGIYWNYKSAQKRGIDYDVRKDSYEKIQQMEFSDIENYFNENIKGRTYTYCVIGKKSDMDMEALKKLGEIRELSLEEIFGY
jgi:zinc protease